MKINGKPYRTIWLARDGASVEIIDQTKLPFAFVTKRLASAEEAAEAIKSMIVHLLRSGSRRPMTLYWGLRSEIDLYYQEEFTSLAKEYPFFKYFVTLSRPTDAWNGLKGRVTSLLPGLIQTVENLDAYLCGNGEMIKEVRALLIEKGMPRKSVHYEKFY